MSFPAGVFATLRARHDGQEITLTWDAARALLPGEHFHLLHADADPSTPFTRLNADGSLARSYTETRRTARLQFFDLRVANACEDESLREYGPGR